MNGGSESAGERTFEIAEVGVGAGEAEEDVDERAEREWTKI